MGYTVSLRELSNDRVEYMGVIQRFSIIPQLF
jgi:hypothetical protein